MSKSKPVESNFRKIIERMAQRRGTYEVYAAFCSLTACALALETREAEYMEEIKRWDKDELQLFAEAMAALILEMQEHPFMDILGANYTEFALSKKSQQWGGVFHTPQPVCDLMAQILGSADNLPKEGSITMCEPACGSGAMILSFARNMPHGEIHRLRVTAIDISKVACDMCFINTTLWGIPAEIYHADALSNEYYKGWRNIHWIFRGALRYLLMPTSAGTPAAVSGAKTILAEAASSQGVAPTPEETEIIKKKMSQGEFDFQ
jgi:type I restriction-modification system DNA methylase subunit